MAFSPRSPRAPRIVHVVHAMEGGGTERHLVDLLNRLDHDRFRHDVVTQRHAGELSSRLSEHVAVYPLHLTGRKVLGGLELLKHLVSDPPAAIHARNPGTWCDALLASSFLPGTQLVLGFHGFDHARGFEWRYRTLCRAARFLGACFSTNSEAGKRALERTGCLRPRSAVLLPNGIDASRFTFDPVAGREVRARLGIPQASLVFGNVGRLTPVKRPLWLVSALHALRDRFPDLHLLLAGDGPDSERIRHLSNRLGLGKRVHLPGETREPAAIYSALDVFVLPSASESRCSSLLEAMACKRACVATDVGDNALVLGPDSAGYLASGPGHENFLKMLDVLLSDQEKRMELGLAARARSRAFSIEKSVRTHEAFYQHLVPCAPLTVSSGFSAC